MLIDGHGQFGDISKFIIVANGKDVSEAITQVIINQSIFSPFWYISLLVNDTTNLVHNVPLYDGCSFKIKIGTKTGSPWDDVKEYSMIMHSIDNSNQVNHMHSKYIINLVDPIVILDNYTSIIKAFDNERHNSAVENIAREYLGKLVKTDPSDSGLTGIIPNLKPFEAINWIAKSATYNGSADFIFFQTDNNEFAFKSLSRMYAEPSKKYGINFTRVPTNLTSLNEAGFDWSTNMVQISLTQPDVLRDSLSGYYGSKIHVYNTINKTFDISVYDGKSSHNFDSANKFEDTLQYSRMNVLKTIVRSDSTSENGVTINENYEKWVGDRRVSMSSISRNILNIQTLGVAGCWKFLGKVCELKLPSQQEVDFDVDDPKFKGKFLVTKITQKINRSTFITNYELIKLHTNK